MIDKRDILNKITPVLEKVAYQLGLIPLEINFLKESGKWHVIVYIYSQDHQISHKDCEDYTNGVSEYLDQLIPVHYYLEVSSPGTERKLKSPFEYNLFKGKRVNIKLKQPIEDNLKVFTAKIIEYKPESGLKVQLTDTDKIVEIDNKNISQIKLKPEYKI
jgi:ribosome maturation factor RimP